MERRNQVEEEIERLKDIEDKSYSLALGLIGFGIIGACFGSVGFLDKWSNMSTNFCFFTPGVTLIISGLGLGIRGAIAGKKRGKLASSLHRKS